MDTFFTLCAQYLFFLPIVVGGVFFLYQPFSKKKDMVVFALIALPLIGVIAFAGNHVYNDPRPFVVGNFTPLIPHSPDNGFPSDHTLLVSAIAVIVFVFNRKLGIFLGVIAVVVGISRIYVGLHHPIDVVGSMVIVVAISTVVKMFVTDRFLKPQDK